MTFDEQEPPPGWACVALADVTRPRSGKMAPQDVPDAPYIGMEQVEAQTMRLIDTVPSGTMKSAANAFQATDVLYGRLRAYLNKVYQPDFAGLCSGEFIVLPESAALRGRFLKYRLNAGDFVRFSSHLNTGDRPRVDFEQIGGFAMVLPPPAEQERIADTLDELFSDLDAAVAALERVRAKLKLYRASVLKAAVEGELTRDWRERHPDAEPASQLLQRILAERRRRWEEGQLAKFKTKGIALPLNWRAKYRNPVAATVADRSSMPASWLAVSVDQLLAAPIVNGLSVRGSDHPPGVRALRLSAMSDSGFDYSAVRYLPLASEAVEDIAIRAGDFFVSRGNGSKHLVGRGTLAQEPGVAVIFPDTMMRIRVLEGDVSKCWLPTVWPSATVRRQIEKAAKTTAGILKISQPDLAGITIPLPPLAEQEAIVELVEDQLSVIDHLEADLAAKLKSAQALRQAILRRAFAGKLVPQDPNDEPAAELLKRIAAERAGSALARPAVKRRSAKAKATA